jgi:glycosyltransferase involved in cell wall biosynthesis
MQNPVASDATIATIQEQAGRAGLRHVHMLAWRDLDDDEAGGSEVHAHQIASIWTQAGVRVTMRTSFAVGRPSVAVRDGYTVSRRGSRYSVFPRSAAAEVMGRLGPCDGLIEIWNGVPFLSPLWWHGPTSVWLHHVHGPMWQQSLPAPAARFGNILEERLAPPFYRRVPVVTLSPSSKEELVDELGFDRDHVTVIPPGLDPFFSPGGTRSATPLAVAVGRLAPVKDFPRLVRVMAEARRKVPDLELVIVGEGYTRPDIEEVVRRVGGADWVHLPGRISDDQLRDLYRRAWMAVSTSTREGWGMTLTEAAACGTPTVATDIAGHADAVAAGRSGLLRTTDADLVDAITSVATDATVRADLQAGALARAAELTWEATAVANFEVLATDALALQAVGGRRRRLPRHGRSGR